MGELEYFVGFMIKCDLTKMIPNISQPHIITNTTQVFNEDAKSLMIFNTPDTPHKRIVHNQETDMKISCDIHKRHMSGLGLLLYLVKHSQPE